MRKIKKPKLIITIAVLTLALLALMVYTQLKPGAGPVVGTASRA